MDTPFSFFVSAIDTDAGKTFVSACLCAGLGADYFKPVQCGVMPFTDSDYIREKVPLNKVHPEGILLKTPASPNIAAEVENVIINVSDLKLPQTDTSLIVEGAGGILVPLNEKEMVIDLAAHWKLPVILVIKTYLGSINHSLLTLSELQRRRIEVYGLVFIEGNAPKSREVIKKISGVKEIASIPYFQEGSIPDPKDIFDNYFTI